MENRTIWSQAALERLLGASDPDVSKWAIGRYFALYPDEARVRLKEFLLDKREPIILAALEHLPDAPDESLPPTLKELYLKGSSAVSAHAVYRLGRWKVTEAVDWMKERLREGRPMSQEQIHAMIVALGELPTPEAYELLKQTEQAVQEGTSTRWDLFYAALLKHRRSDDIETLIGTFLNAQSPDDRRRSALGLLTAQADSGLNPSDLLFANTAAIEAHFRQRIAGLREELRSPEGTSGLELAALEALPDRFGSENPQEFLADLERLTEGLSWDQPYDRAFFSATLRHIPEDPEQQVALLGLAAAILIHWAVDSLTPPLPPDASWQDQLKSLLGDRADRPDDARLESVLLRTADPAALCSRLIAELDREPRSWGAFRAARLLASFPSADAAQALARAASRVQDPYALETFSGALVAMGPVAVPAVIPLLERPSPSERAFALDTLAQLPTPEAVEAIVLHFPALFEADPVRTLEAATAMGAAELIPAVEAHYYPGEWAVGESFLLLCRLHNLNPPRFAEILKDVRHGREVAAQERQLLSGESNQWPRTLQLELACRACGKRFHYEVSEIHLHPHYAAGGTDVATDATPYHHGIVIRDDLRCKSCQALNQMDLTAATLSQLTAESLKLLAFQRSGRTVPQYYPLKHVQLDEKDGKPLSLSQVEQEHLGMVERHGGKPQGHLALAKFYEYVKEYAKAKESYLKTLDLDSKALEALAGIARLTQVAGRAEEAYEWIDECYEKLDSGSIYLAEDPKGFKKAVREKRSEYAQAIGIHPESPRVAVRFHIDSPDYPKNRPCPCGSGKKYKVCCMNKDAPSGS